jgi:nucleoside-diphosphate-sugar epimerase
MSVESGLYNKNCKVLITGCTGYIGASLLEALSSNENFSIVGAARRPFKSNKCNVYIVGEMDGTVDWRSSLNSVDVVVHAAGVAHFPKGRRDFLSSEYQRVNVDGTLNLARQAARLGVKRFIYISSVGVNGVKTIANKPFTEIDKPSPHNEYAHSKWEAEQGLLETASNELLDSALVYSYGRCNNKLKNNTLRPG